MNNLHTCTLPLYHQRYYPYTAMWQCYSHYQLLEVLHVTFMVCVLIDN